MHGFFLRFSQVALSLLGLVFFAGTPAVAEVPTKIHGRVVLDANTNGQLDPNEQGLPSIAVTDGVQIVETNEKRRLRTQRGTTHPTIQREISARGLSQFCPSKM